MKFGIYYECNIPVKHVKGISVQSTKNIKIDEKYVSILSNYRVYDDILKIELSRNSVLDQKVNFLDPNLDRLHKKEKKNRIPASNHNRILLLYYYVFRSALPPDKTESNNNDDAPRADVYRRAFQTQMKPFIFVNSLYLARNTAPCFTLIWMGNGRWFLPFHLQS